MAELADALDSKSSSFTRVRVRPPLQVPVLWISKCRPAEDCCAHLVKVKIPKVLWNIVFYLALGIQKTFWGVFTREEKL